MLGYVMANRNLRDFYERIARILRMHAQGYGFEAAGTLGRSYYARRQRLRVPVIAPVLVVMAGVVFLKAMLHAGLGAQDYEARVAALWTGSAFDRVGAFLMQPDPATLWVADLLVRVKP